MFYVDLGVGFWVCVVFIVNVVSYCLFGEGRRYTVNMLVNAELCGVFYPGWVVRVYFDDSVPFGVIGALGDFGYVELVRRCDFFGESRRLMRFLAVDDCDVVLCRDADSYVCEREVAAVDEWLLSGRSLHVMRDHKYHVRHVQAGMFGLRGGFLDMGDLVREFVDGTVDHIGMDEVFLAEHVYHRYVGDMVVHDDFGVYGDRTHGWPRPVEYYDEEGGYIGRRQFPPAVHVDRFRFYESVLECRRWV